MKKNNVLNQKLYSNIQTIIESSKNAVSRAVNSAMVRAYWEIGRLIFEEEQKGKSRADYGSYIVKSLSLELSKDYGKGFSVTNLKQMRQFYSVFAIGQTLSDQLSWSHYQVLTRVEEKAARQFYMKECTNSGWSVRELERQTASLLFERLSLSKNKKQTLTLSQKGHEISQPSDLVKDPEVLEFLGLKKESVLYEKKLETALIEHLQGFLLELGKLTHQDIGQMQMYLNYYKRTQKIQGENDPIGISLCSDKNDTVVEFTLPEGKQEIFASKYELTLPSKKELKVEIQKERKLLENYSRKVSK